MYAVRILREAHPPVCPRPNHEEMGGIARFE